MTTTMTAPSTITVQEVVDAINFYRQHHSQPAENLSTAEQALSRYWTWLATNYAYSSNVQAQLFRTARNYVAARGLGTPTDRSIATYVDKLGVSDRTGASYRTHLHRYQEWCRQGSPAPAAANAIPSIIEQMEHNGVSVRHRLMFSLVGDGYTTDDLIALRWAGIEWDGLSTSSQSLFNEMGYDAWRGSDLPVFRASLDSVEPLTSKGIKSAMTKAMQRTSWSNYSLTDFLDIASSG